MIKGGSVLRSIVGESLKTWRQIKITLILLAVLVAILRLVWFCPVCHQPITKGGGTAVFSSRILGGVANFVGCHQCAEKADIQFDE